VEEKRRNVYKLLEGKPEEKRPLGRPRRRSVDNITMGLLRIGLGGVDWIDVALDGLVVESSCEPGNEPSGSIKFWESIEWLHILWRLEW
jgi:hypothetical protein